ncbi:MAG: ParB/RepB/Spo0J family partition protein [Ruminococcaceae bacterium]|nr:ParB/RepB/Spo0J family partition protein [Oscillospiraceae bacterium]
MAKSRIGRSFFDLLDDNMLPGDRTNAATMLRIADIEPRRDQPRKTFEHEALESLADSIGQFGVLQPIIVRESQLLEGTYEIVAGERRWRASKMAGLNEIPAVVLDGDDLKAAQVAVIENIQREDLNPVEEAMAYDALIDRYGLTQEQVAKQVGKNRATIANALRLLELPEEVLELLKNGDLSAGHARALLGLKNEGQMLPLAQKIIEKELSVRDVEKTVRLMNYEPQAVEEEDELSQRKVYMKDLEHRAVRALGRKVRILKTAKKKVVELAYSDDDDLEALLSALCGADFFANND